MRRAVRIALLVIAVAAAALAAGVLAFVVGVEVPGEFLRAPIERALTAAFGMPARIEGPIRLRTGLAARVSADALVFDDPSGPAGATLARGIRPGAQIDLVALLRRVVTLEEVTGERLELTLVRRAGGQANWAPVFARPAGHGAASFSFGGIDRLRIGQVAGSFVSEGGAPVSWVVEAFDGALPRQAPAAARGRVEIAGQPVAFDLRSATLADLLASAAAFPVQGTVDWSGARVGVDGALARDGSRFDADMSATAEDAGALLAALGIAAAQPGRLELRLRLGVTATEATAQDLALTVGGSAVSGSASVGWAAPRLRVAADLAGGRVDLAPFALARSLPPEKTLPEALLDLLEQAATGVDVGLRLAVDELAGLPVTVQGLRFEGRSGERAAAGNGAAVVAGTRVEVRLDYDARKARRTLWARVEGGAASTAALPGKARPRELSGRVAGIRGTLRAQGENARALLASVEADFEAHDLRWTVAAPDGAPLAGRFDRARVLLQGARASSVEVSGKLGDAACALKVSGGALAPLFEGAPWPLLIAGSCPSGHLHAKGRLAVAQRQVAGELAFELAADRIGPVAKALGFAPGLPQPVAARGTLVLDGKTALARLATLRLGRTAGSGEVAVPLGADGAARAQLRLTSLDLDEFAAAADQGSTPAGRREQETGQTELRLPDLDFDIAANRVAIAGNGLRQLRFGGAVRAGKLPPAGFGFDWEGVPVSGRLAADFSAAVPRIELNAAAQKVVLRAFAATLGLADARVRAEVLSLKAHGTGRRLGELLAATTLEVTVDGGQFDLGRRGPLGRSGRGEFSATLAAAPGKPAVLAVRGTIDGEPIDLAIEVSGLAGFARADAAVPVAARVSVGDARLDASGTVARNGSAQGKVRITGEWLDRLGRLIGTALPQVGPYSASGNVTVAADVVRAGDVAASFGRSRLTGEVRAERRAGNRPRYVAELRAPVLHLEDLGAKRWRDGSARAAAGKSPATPAAREGGAIEAGLELLRAADVDATIDFDEVRGAGERFAGGRLRATVEAGVLRAHLQQVRTAGGAADADIRVDASATPPRFGLRAQTRELEVGALLRAVDPGSTAAGKLDLVADLATQGRSEDLLPALTGTVDAAVYPRRLLSDGLGLWGSGLLNALLGQLDPKSRASIDCAVTSIDFGDGRAKSSALFVDTARVRIVGELEVDLATRALSGRIDPVSKQPQILAFAPTMLLGGTVDAPRLVAAPGNVVTVPLRMAAPLSGFALDWLGSKQQGRGVAAGCREAFERIRQVRAEAVDRPPR